MVKAGSKGPRSILKSRTISRRATVLGRKRETCRRFAWCGPLVIVTACRRRCAARRRCRAVPSCCVLWCCCMPSLSSLCPHASSSSALHPPSLSRYAPCCCALSLHCRAAVVPLDPPPLSPSVIALLGIIAVVPLGAVVMPSSHCWARCRRHHALACPVPVSLCPFAILLCPSASLHHCVPSLLCAVCVLYAVGVHSLAWCLGCGPVDGVVERALLGPLACGMHGCHHCSVLLSLSSVHRLVRLTSCACV